MAVSGGMVSQTDRLEDTQFTVEELQAAVAEARARETYETAHAHNCRSIRNGLEAAVARAEEVEQAMQRAVRIAAQAGVTLGSGSDLIGPDQQRAASSWR